MSTNASDEPFTAEWHLFITDLTRRLRRLQHKESIEIAHIDSIGWHPKVAFTVTGSNRIRGRLDDSALSWNRQLRATENAQLAELGWRHLPRKRETVVESGRTTTSTIAEICVRTLTEVLAKDTDVRTYTSLEDLYEHPPCDRAGEPVTCPRRYLPLGLIAARHERVPLRLDEEAPIPVVNRDSPTAVVYDRPGLAAVVAANYAHYREASLIALDNYLDSEYLETLQIGDEFRRKLVVLAQIKVDPIHVAGSDDL